MRFGLVLSEAANGLRRNATMVVSVVLVTFISLTFVGTAALMQLQIAQMKNYWYDRAQVAVYLCTSRSRPSSTSSTSKPTSRRTRTSKSSSRARPLRTT